MEHLISINQLCEYHQLEVSFFIDLSEAGLLEIEIIKEQPYVHQESIATLEKMIRLYHELGINIAGIDTVLNLLNKIDQLQNELAILKSKLSRYED